MSDHLNEVPPAARLLSREIVSVDSRSGEVKLRFTARDEFANRHGTVQGGMLAAMLDSATGNAVMANLPSDLTAVTTRLDTAFHKPAALGVLTATARLVHRDERSAEVEAELIDAKTAPIEPSLKLLDGLHYRWVVLLNSLSDNDVMRKFTHPELGVVSIDQYIALYAWHSRHHVAHITSLRERKAWQ